MLSPRLRSLSVLLSFLLACSADSGNETRDVSARESSAPDTELPTEDSGAVEDTPVIEPEAEVPDEGMNTDPDAEPPPMDATPPPMDVVVVDTVVRDTATNPMRDATALGDAFQPPRDGGDPTPRDVNLFAGGAAMDAPTRFSGTEDTSRAPSIVYPAPEVLLPVNLQGFEVHFRPGTGNDLFEVAFRGDRGTVRIYTPCTSVNGGCVLTMDATAYAELARVAQPGGVTSLTVRGTSASAAGRWGRSAAQNVLVTNTDVRGGLYYWAAGAGSILRYEFARPGARPEVYLRGDPINCVGCHTMSRDGTLTAVGRGIPGPSATRVYDVPSRAGVSADFGSNFAAFSPDNLRLLSSTGMTLQLLETTTWRPVAGLPSDVRGSMPDWSRDGRTVVYSRTRGATIPIFGSPGHGAPADLLTMSWNGTSFGTPTAIVSANGMENNYYPGFSPDDRWIVFNRGGGDSYNAIDAQVWAVRADRSAPPVRLARADGTGQLGNSWPKWAPFVQSFQGEPLLWLTFSSRRDYGLRIQQQTREPDMRVAQLWMAAFRPNRATGGADPSSPPFWLPFQDPRSGNHIGQWSEAVQRQTCGSNRECAPGEQCVQSIAMAGSLVCVGQ